ncbi:hypothetical protein [Micromonospora wenchangensis]|nr:hypothetical protein [Micromonospora wenchangensis]
MATWKGVLAPLGAKSGDRRIFAADGDWSFRDLPLPLRWAREGAPGHEGAVTIGRITAGEVQKSRLAGTGDFIDAVPELGEALELLRAGVLFPSVDLDDFEFMFTDEKGTPIEDMSDEEWEAFMEAGEEPYITVTKGRVMAVTLVGTQAFPDAKLELVDDEPAEEEPADEEPKEEEAVAALGEAAAKKQVAPLYPPRTWFDDPGLTELTPITVTADGRVFGHLADRDCHLSFLTGGQCVLPPDEGGFDWFRRPEIQTAEGELVAVGHITAGTGHADLSASAAAAVEHYDDTGTQVAVVRAGRDAQGTWVAGSLVPEATEEQVQLPRRSPLSGDWRWIGGARQLVAALCVNVGGFPVVRGRSSGGWAYAMVASGWAGWKASDPTLRRQREPLSPQALDAAVPGPWPPGSPPSGSGPPPRRTRSGSRRRSAATGRRWWRRRPLRCTRSREGARWRAAGAAPARRARRYGCCPTGTAGPAGSTRRRRTRRSPTCARAAAARSAKCRSRGPRLLGERIQSMRIRQRHLNRVTVSDDDK